MSYSSEVMLDAPDVYFRLSETGSGPLVDVIGANNATPNTTIVTGASLLSSDGDAGITLARNSGFKIATTTYPIAQVPMSIEFWIKPSNLTGPAYCFTSNDGSHGWTVSYTNATGAWGLQEWGGSGFNFSGAVVSGVRQHVVFVLSSSNNCSLYLNGAFSQTITGGAAMVATTVALAIGNPTSGPAAVIDEFAIYKSELPGYRVAAHYQAGVAGQVLSALGVGV
jgi:hypothetical protein